MKKIVTSVLGLWLWAALAIAAETPFKDGVPERYTVKEGDTLWGISAMFLSDPWKWPEVWSANPQIENPHLIYPGDVIALVYIDGGPRLVLERNGYSSPSGATSAGGRTIRLTPQIKAVPHEEAIAAIPLEAVNNFLARTRVVQPGELDAAPYVLAGHERRLVSGKGDDFYVRGALEPSVDFYGIYRKGDPYIDDETKEVLGIKAEDIGSAQLKATNGDVATFLATRSEREIRVGDRLLAHEERRLDTTFFPKAPETDIAGKIIAVEGGVTQVGTLNVVALNRGEREGLAIGNVLAIYKVGELITDRVTGEKVALPSERAGLLMVFRTFEKMSFGLVLTADRPLAVKDEVRSP
jgi:nucleoid-associated protein YgaU